MSESGNETVRLKRVSDPPDERNLLTKILDAILALALVGMLLLLLTEIVARSFFSTSTLVADEYSAYGLVVVGFLGLGRALSTGSHVRVGALIAAVSHRPILKKSLETFAAVALVVFALIGAQQLGLFAFHNWERGTTAPTITRTPLFIPQAIAALGFLLLAVAAVGHLIRVFRGKDADATSDQQEVGEV